MDINEPMNVNQHVCIIRVKRESDSMSSGLITPFYLNYFLQSDVGQTQVQMRQTGGNREGLTFENLKSFLILLPDTQEQHKIVGYLNRQIQQINKLIDLWHNRISKLKEYRQSLISEVVTGKICVVDDVPTPME